MWGGKSIHDEKEGASSSLLLSREIWNLAAFFRRSFFQGIVGFCFTLHRTYQEVISARIM